ncbi:MAG: hypothetical protein ACD_2C00210G0007 [uncultured bacterium (gcode 4)]|uniref:Uncharacterized protein n=1 Tax=uncultured bacterium (gcode 4) TaxID=1234023 RepID=K2GFU8_9BACT|nr:MAG: hypothetical protein ACD_2C00210G0007 [uncultured bacterium (gcode 4)]
MKSKFIIYPTILLFTVWVPLVKYYTNTPGQNACVLDYVDNLDKSNYKWYLYNIDWYNHIEPWNSTLLNWIEQYKTWRSIWCLMVSDNLFNDINNTFYCSVTYMIRKAPIDPKLKEPLGIIK